jgi:hypothetical protein
MACVLALLVAVAPQFRRFDGPSDSRKSARGNSTLRKKLFATVGSVLAAAMVAAATSAVGAGTAHNSLTTEHFTLRAQAETAELQRWGKRCETLLVELRAKWFEQTETLGGWSPRCEVVVHADAASYVRAVPGGERSVGSSWIETERGRIVTRRIDIRGDIDDWMAGALAHELIHVLLADRFLDGLPRWAEEGLALLADPEHKQARHDLDFRRALSSRTQFRVGELVVLNDYPSASRITTFYGQSASLVRFLAARRPPAEFVAFVEKVGQIGYDAALRDVYAIDGVSALETAWLRSLTDSQLADAR